MSHPIRIILFKSLDELYPSIEILRGEDYIAEIVTEDGKDIKILVYPEFEKDVITWTEIATTFSQIMPLWVREVVGMKRE